MGIITVVSNNSIQKRPISRQTPSFKGDVITVIKKVPIEDKTPLGIKLLLAYVLGKTNRLKTTIIKQVPYRGTITQTNELASKVQTIIIDTHNKIIIGRRFPKKTIKREQKYYKIAKKLTKNVPEANHYTFDTRKGTLLDRMKAVRTGIFDETSNHV